MQGSNCYDDGVTTYCCCGSSSGQNAGRYCTHPSDCGVSHSHSPPRHSPSHSHYPHSHYPSHSHSPHRHYPSSPSSSGSGLLTCTQNVCGCKCTSTGPWDSCNTDSVVQDGINRVYGSCTELKEYLNFEDCASAAPRIQTIYTPSPNSIQCSDAGGSMVTIIVIAGGIMLMQPYDLCLLALPCSLVTSLLSTCSHVCTQLVARALYSLLLVSDSSVTSATLQH